MQSRLCLWTTVHRSVRWAIFLGEEPFFILILVWCTATLWLGLCLTKNFEAFVGLSFVTAITTVTPQLMLPLVGDLAPTAKRAQSLSIVVSGLLLGIC